MQNREHIEGIDTSKLLGGDGDIADLGVCKLVYDFLKELSNRFPHRKRLTYTLEKYWTLAQANLAVPGQKLQEMHEACLARKKTVFSERTQENEAIVIDELARVHYFQMCQIKTMWKIDGDKPLDMRTRKVIWEHVTRIMQVVSILSKFSGSSRTTLNRLANDTLNEQERSSLKDGQFDIVSLLDNVQKRMLNDDEMVTSIIDVANKTTDEMKEQGISEDSIKEMHTKML